jgi:hypothetical protein
MTTVKLAVAKLISKNAVLSNYDIERVNGEHPLSGLRKMRELKKEFKDKYPKLTAYTFGNNKYAFKKMFQVFCNRYAKEYKKRNEHEIKFEHDGWFCKTECPHGKNMLVGSTACSECEHHISQKGKTVICAYPKKAVVK